MPTSENNPSPSEFPPVGHRSPGHSFPNEKATTGLLVAYFRSGWVFFIPYLAAYLLYAWLKWPLNPIWDIRTQPSAINPIQIPPLLTPPCLLNVYWFLHGLHLIFGALALTVWWRRDNVQLSKPADDCNSLSVLGPLPALDQLWPVLPWLCLALLIWIPGVYLEMPSDPWAHLARINEWSNMATPLANPEWIKSGSFLGYSFVGPLASSSAQLAAFNFFYAGCCLLYCWQYFLLAQAIGLTQHRSFIAVLLNLFLFGNNIFGFQRYYGMSTTILAQIGILALTRGLILRLPRRARSESNFGPARNWQERMTRWASDTCFFGATLAMIGMNHVQGLAIASISVVAVLGWYVTNASVRKTVWFGTGVLLVNFLVVWLWPRHANLDNIYRPGGWLTSVYGFNLLDPTSPAFERAIQILGVMGIVNLAIGVLLLLRRQLVGWLTVAPLLLLLLPVFALPFSDAVSRFGPPGFEYILSFNRLLLGIPAGLALCAWTPECLNALNSMAGKHIASLRSTQASNLLLPGTAATVLLFLILPTSRPFFNRFWHQLMIVPNDLREQHIVNNARSPLFVAPFQTSGIASPDQSAAAGTRPPILSTPGVGFVLGAFGVRPVLFRNKWMMYPERSTPIDRIQDFELWLYNHKQSAPFPLIIIPTYPTLFSANSFAGFLSGHWFSNQVALEQTGGPEAEARAISSDYQVMSNLSGVRIFSPTTKK